MPHETTTQSRSLAAERTRVLAAFRATFTSESGRIVLAALRDSAGHGHPAFLPPAGGGPLDPYAAAFRDGRKSILDEIDANLSTPEDEAPAGPAAKK